MILDSLLAGMMLFSSFAMRSPNQKPNPDDYELSIGLSHNNFFINRQWERELGEPYIDDLVWAKFDANSVYFKPEYMNKESHEVKYMKMDWRRSWKDATFGFTTRSTNDNLSLYETFASVGVSKKKKYKDDRVEVEISFDGYMPPDESGENTTFEFEDKFKVSWLITKKVKIYNMGEVAKLKGQDYYKAKIGIEIAL
tara:strand:- start:142 stop:732 length:591 start_codon:yes stop_codon:yes gene_type:complete